jgi:hypothetical protein
MTTVAEAAQVEDVLLNVLQGNVLWLLPSFLLEREHVDFATELISRIINITSDESVGSPSAQDQSEANAEVMVPAAV